MNMRSPVQGLGLGRDRVVWGPGPGRGAVWGGAGALTAACSCRLGEARGPAGAVRAPGRGHPMGAVCPGPFGARLCSWLTCPVPHPHAEALLLLKALTVCEDGWRWAFEELVTLQEISGASSELTRVLRRDRGRDVG